MFSKFFFPNQKKKKMSCLPVDCMQTSFNLWNLVTKLTNLIKHWLSSRSSERFIYITNWFFGMKVRHETYHLETVNCYLHMITLWWGNHQIIKKIFWRAFGKSDLLGHLERRRLVSTSGKASRYVILVFVWWIRIRRNKIPRFLYVFVNFCLTFMKARNEKWPRLISQ